MILERIFFTSNQKFYAAFDELAAQMRKMSKLLHLSVKDGHAQAGTHVQEMEGLEVVNAKLINNLFTELGRNLITPFDREDIHFLATDLSNIGRSIFYLTKQIRNYSIHGAGAITEVVLEQTDTAMGLLAEILDKLKDVRALSGLADVCTEIRRIMNECDQLVDRETSVLLREEKDEIRVIKMMDHYEVLQKLLTNIGNTVGVCESIIIKYG